MKRIIKFSFNFFLLISFIIYFISCSDDAPTKTTEEINFIAYQIPGCNSSWVLGKVSFVDSCFMYSFNDTLKVDFCVPGNCCPDSNRFVTNYSINSDTIYVTVADTAANLCYCICNYIIHLEISGLPNDKYLFYCKYDDLEYKEIVIRSN